MVERGRRWKSKRGSAIDGFRTQVSRNRVRSKLSLDSYAYIDGSTRDILPLVLELGQRSPRQSGETLIKELLAQEMSEEFFPKRRSPNVIAKLMGLDGMPSPRHVHRQQKLPTESYQQKNLLINTQKFSPMRQQEFRDVYEDMEASHIVSSQWLSRWSSGPMLTKPKMHQIQQKSMEAKCDPVDENLHRLKEMIGAALPNSGQAACLKDGQNQYSYSSKRLHDQKIHPSLSRHNHMAARKPLDYTVYDRAKRMKSVKYEGSLHLDPRNKHRAHISHKSSMTQLKDKFGENILPVRIVLLKPNLGKVQNTHIPLPSHDHSYDHLPDFRNMKEHSNLRSSETVSCRRKSSCYDEGLKKSMSNETREKASNTTLLMKDGYDVRMTSISSHIRGYAGDESSCDDFESDSDSESEVSKLHSENALGGDFKFPYYYVESHIEKAERKRLSERWKMRHGYQNAQIATKECTHDELLVRRGRERKRRYFNNKMGFGYTNSELGCNNGDTMWDGPSGMNCIDEWNDKTNKSSARSRSLPPSTGGRNQYGIMCNHALHVSKNSDPMSRCRNKAVKENLDCKTDTVYECSNSSSIMHGKSINELDSPLSVNYGIKVEANIEDLSKQPPMFQTASNDETCSTPVPDVIRTPEHQLVILPLEPPELFPKQGPASIVMHTGSTDFHQGDSIFQEMPEGQPEKGSPSLDCFGTEPDFSESSKESDNLSPVSVLEIPCTEDITSTTECFETVGAELRELRMQLQLLKMESGTHDEDETTLQSPTASEGNYKLSADNWEASYISDMLSIIEESNLDAFKVRSTSEFPLDHGVFNDLEEKYSNATIMPRHDRKMLFDRVNSTLIKVFEQHMDACPWVMPKMVGIDSGLQKEKVRHAVEKLIWPGNANEELSERVMDEEMQWLYSNKEMELLGNEIANIFVDEMILEVIF